MITPAKQGDSFTISYSIWAALLFLLFAVGNDLDRIFNLWLLLVPLLLFPAIVAAIAWIVILLRNAFLRRWRRVVSVIAAPLLAFSFFAALGALGVNTERIRLELGRQYYLDQVAQLPQTEIPRIKTFDWGGTGGAGVANIFYTLVYDESDELARPEEQRSAAWRRRMSEQCPGGRICSILKSDPRRIVEIKRIQGHFYLATELYQ